MNRRVNLLSSLKKNGPNICYTTRVKVRWREIELFNDIGAPDRRSTNLNDVILLVRRRNISDCFERTSLSNSTGGVKNKCQTG